MDFEFSKSEAEAEKAMARLLEGINKAEGVVVTGAEAVKNLKAAKKYGYYGIFFYLVSSVSLIISAFTANGTLLLIGFMLLVIAIRFDADSKIAYARAEIAIQCGGIHTMIYFLKHKNAKPKDLRKIIRKYEVDDMD